jgi:hypothetical protein
MTKVSLEQAESMFLDFCIKNYVGSYVTLFEIDIPIMTIMCNINEHNWSMFFDIMNNWAISKNIEIEV